jgi:hypothetical protein
MYWDISKIFQECTIAKEMTLDPFIMFAPINIWGWKHIKVEYIILSQFVGLSIMGHGTKYKWIMCEKDSKNNIICDMITLYEFYK